MTSSGSQTLKVLSSTRFILCTRGFTQPTGMWCIYIKGECCKTINIQIVDRLLVTGPTELYRPSALALADQRALSANRASWVSPISARFHAETRPTN